MKFKEFIDLLETNNETSIIAILDLSNMFHWQDTLHWQFSVYEVVKQLSSIKYVKEIRIYYGLNNHDLDKSKNFHRRLRECGAILITKPVKWIKKSVCKELFVKSSTLSLLDSEAHIKLDEFIIYLQEKQLYIEEPKCNFDVEMALDILDSSEKISSIFLFSGDSDMHEPVNRLRLKGKKTYVFGVRNQVSQELMNSCERFINFGKWYEGVKMRKSRP
jgi:uncharacterized LabA/DUF88 family protein